MASQERHYDVVVIGSVPSGRIVAQRLAKNSFAEEKSRSLFSSGHY